MAATKRLKVEPDPIGERLLTIREAAATRKFQLCNMRRHFRDLLISLQDLAGLVRSVGIK